MSELEMAAHKLGLAMQGEHSGWHNQRINRRYIEKPKATEKRRFSIPNPNRHLEEVFAIDLIKGVI